MKNIHNSKTSVKTNEISQRQWTHRHICAVLHDTINILFAAYASFEADNCFVDIWHENAIGEETRRIGRDGGDFAHALDELECRLESFGGSLQSGDDLNTLLNGDGIHEMRRYDTGRSLEVCGIFGCSCGDFGDGYRGCVCSEDGVFWCYLRELGEDGGLEVGDFGDGFNYEVDVGEVVQFGAGDESAAD